MYMTRFLLVVLGLFAVVGGCTSSNAGGLRPSKEEFTSDCLEVTMGGMTVDPDVGLALTLGLKNTTQEAAWVRVRFESPPPNTSRVGFLAKTSMPDTPTPATPKPLLSSILSTSIYFFSFF